MARPPAQDQPPAIEPATNAATLLAALASASQQDLEELDRQIETVTRELADATVGFRRKLDALQAARRLVALSLNGAPPRQPRGTRKAKASPPERVVTTGRVVADEPEDLIEEDESGDTPARARESQDKVEVRVRDLLREEGAMPVKTIGSRLGIQPTTIYSAAQRSGWFQLSAGLLHLKGRA